MANDEFELLTHSEVVGGEFPRFWHGLVLSGSNGRYGPDHGIVTEQKNILRRNAKRGPLRDDVFALPCWFSEITVRGNVVQSPTACK